MTGKGLFCAKNQKDLVDDVCWNYSSCYFSVLVDLSPTAVNPDLTRLAWLFWTTSTGTGSSGTTSGATTRSRSSARMSRDIFSSPGRPSPIFASPEGTKRHQSSPCCYLFIVFPIALLIIQQCAANQIGHIPRYEDGKYTLFKPWERYIMMNVFTT